jgi:hypothetical protein
LSVAKWSSGKRRFPQFRHGRFPIPELACLEVTLFDLFRQFDSANRDRRVVESFESEHRPNSLFDSPMVRFDEIVQVLTRSHFLLVAKGRRSPSFPALRDAMPHRHPA